MSYSDTQILGASLHVKKITSLNPTKFKFMTLALALAQYHDYFGLEYFLNDNQPKSFNQWLKTEI